jgi:hypothetical protein
MQVLRVTAKPLPDRRHLSRKLKVGSYHSREMVVQSRMEIIRLLKNELDFLDRGGYRDSPPWRPMEMFVDSPSCPNRLEPVRSTPCSQCWLFQFVPERYRLEMDPCHFIPLNSDGETIHSVSRQYSPGEVEAALKGWLQTEIEYLESLDRKSAATGD